MFGELATDPLSSFSFFYYNEYTSKNQHRSTEAVLALWMAARVGLLGVEEKIGVAAGHSGEAMGWVATRSMWSILPI